MKTISELAREAILVQDACNLSAIVHSFSRAMTNLRQIAREEGWEDTDKLNQHPIAVLFSDKIRSLTNSDSTTTFSSAYDWATEVTSKV